MVSYHKHASGFCEEFFWVFSLFIRVFPCVAIFALVITIQFKLSQLIITSHYISYSL